MGRDMIKLYNTRTKTKEAFTPLDEKNVRMYVCGPTVYDRAHIGNARPVVVFDVLYRLLRHTYGPEAVTYVRNFTDVDDKINARATETGRSIREITDETIGWYHDDMEALGTLRPDHEPRATEYIDQMVAMIADLVAKGFAYEAEGHVLFEVAKYEGYGRLSNRSLDEMLEGARVEVAPYKRSAMDFVLWKPSTPDLPGWDSPWGRGRPGWHIECSAMARELLGEVFDIHGGGIDLAFPHHENERAQSCAAHGTEQMAQVWMHNGFLNVEGEKMSKSLGNFFTVRDLLDKGVPGEVIRFVLLSTHYRKPMDFSQEKVSEAENEVSRIFELVHGEDSSTPSSKVIEALSDDLNTPLAITHVRELVKNRDIGTLSASLDLLGINFPQMEFGWTGRKIQSETVDEAIRNLVSEAMVNRHTARKNGEYSKADKIRDALTSAGIIIHDHKDRPATWEYSRQFDPSKLEALK